MDGKELIGIFDKAIKAEYPSLRGLSTSNFWHLHFLLNIQFPNHPPYYLIDQYKIIGSRFNQVYNPNAVV